MTGPHLNVVEMHRVCSRCEQSKPHSAFYLSRGVPCSPCKDCARGDAPKRLKPSEQDTHRECRHCHETKPLNMFDVDRSGTYGRKSRCKICTRQIGKERYPEKRRFRTDRIPAKYGIEYDHAVKTLAAQHGLCANRACGKEIFLKVPMAHNRAVIDHDHVTGKFRAMLCMSCNLTLGKIEADKNKMLGLLEYLDKFS